MRITKCLSVASATLAPGVAEQRIKIDLAGLKHDRGRVQSDPERIERAQDQPDLGSRLSCLEVREPAAAHPGRRRELRLGLAAILPTLTDNEP